MLNLPWRAKPLAIAALLVTLLGAAASAQAGPTAELASTDPLGLNALPLADDPAFGWVLLLPNDPPGSIDAALVLFYGMGVSHLPSPPAPASSATGNLAPRASASYGALTLGSGPTNPFCTHTDALAIHPSGRFAYFGGGIGSPGRLCGYGIDPVTGEFTPVAGSPVATASLPSAIAIEPAGKFMYVASPVSNNIWGYSIDPATGVASSLPGFPLATGGFGPGAIAIDRGGRFAYVANGYGKSGAGSISVFALNRDSGVWTPIAGSPFEMDPVFNDQARSLAITPDGRFLFVGGGVGVHTYAVDANTGGLQLIAQRDSVFPAGVAVDPTGRFLYVPDYDKYLVRGFAIAANGALTPVGTQPYGTPNPSSSRGIAILGDLVYVANTAAKSVYGYRIQATTGALTPVAGSPFAAGARSFALAGQGVLGATMQIDAGDNFVAPIGVFGGQPPYTFAITNGTLPPGLTLNATTGVIAGSPTANGAYTFTAQVTDQANATSSRVKTIFVGGTPYVTAAVVEFYNASLDHYFITWVADEIAKLDAGTEIKGWTRTGKTFMTFTAPQGGTSPVCRYYIPPGLGDSHYFGRGTIECDDTGRKNPSFVLEETNFMNMILPTDGICPGSTFPVYRVFSNRADANHRYTIERQVRDAMVAKGWLAEGDGPDLVVMCAPQ